MNPKKISRICWNTNNWVKPSGPEGKSRNVNKYGEKVFEYEHGFGHEEWLLDTSKNINGWHYSFLQSINNFRSRFGTYIGEKFDISLYTINFDTKERYWIGEVRNAKVIDEIESIDTLKKYKSYKWYPEMLDSIKNVEGNYNELHNIEGKDFFNIKYKIGDVVMLDEPILVDNNDSSISTFHYILINKVSEPILTEKIDGHFNFKPGINPKKLSTYKKYKKNTKALRLEHNEVQEMLYKYLCSQYGKGSVGTENSTGFGSRVDIVVKEKNKFTFYELKTGSDLLSNVRNAFTQLMEYCYYPNRKNAHELVIVSLLPINDKVECYLKTIRNSFRIPIFYKQFDKNNNVLI